MVKKTSNEKEYVNPLPVFLLTNLFDLSLYIKEGKGFAGLLQSYNFWAGNMWILVVLTAIWDDLVKDFALCGAVEASKDANGKADPYKATGVVAGMGNFSVKMGWNMD